MDILYLSSLCTIKEYERMFNKYGSTSSHAAQKFNRMLVDGFVRNGCEVDALTQRITISMDREEYKRPDEIENEVHFHYLPCYKNRLKNRLMTIFNARKEIVKWIKKHKNGIVICDIILGELSIATWLSSMLHHCHTIAIVTDVPSIRAGEKRKGIKSIPYKIKNYIIRTYHGYIFLTEQMNKALNLQKKPYIVIEGIVDSHVLDKPNTLAGKYKKKVCLMAGLLEEIFGVEDLIEAFQKVDNPDARLVFYGKGSSLESIKSAEKKDSRIKYLGELTNSQIVDEEKKATLLINPRPPVGEWTAYSFPSKNMEYIASGTPMLAYYLPCIPDEYFPHSFYIMDANNRIDSLKSMLTNILAKDAEELYRRGCEAQKWIVQNKNAESQAKRIIEMLSNFK